MKPGLEVLILAGGGGTRLWPLSRETTPKPFLPLAGGVSPLRRAARLARRIAGTRHCWVVASPALAPRIRAHLGAALGNRLILEPAPRDTAAALALGASVVRQRSEAEWLLCLPADQWIRRPAVFARMVWRIVSRTTSPCLVTFGVPAAWPQPGYGYIEVGPRVSAALRMARRFVEKPTAPRAARFLRSGRWVWNSGMFLWPAETFLAEVRRLLPGVARAVSELTAPEAARRRTGLRLWRSLKPVSVDHAVLERARQVMVAACDIGWQDLGSWEAIAEILPRAADGTAHRGRYLSAGGADCLIYAPGHLTANLGVRRIGLVATRDALLLFKRSQHERIREIVRRLGRTASLARYR